MLSEEVGQQNLRRTGRCVGMPRNEPLEARHHGYVGSREPFRTKP